MGSLVAVQMPYPAKKKWFTSFSKRPGSPITPETAQSLPLPLLIALYPDVTLYGPAATTISQLYEHLRTHLHDSQLYLRLEAYTKELQKLDWQTVRSALIATDPELAANLTYWARDFGEDLKRLDKPIRLATVGIITTTAALSMHQTGEPNPDLPVERSKIEQVVRLWAKHKKYFSC